jgi:hypothetical protein
MSTASIKKLSPLESEILINVLKVRFEENRHRHQDLEWRNIQTKLEATTEKLWPLNAMEPTGVEPDVVGYNTKTDATYLLIALLKALRDVEACVMTGKDLKSRKAHKPKNNVIDMAASMGVNLLSEEQYRNLQQLGDFDTKTSSWLQTPSAIRKLGGAIFADRRFNTVFVYHNGAQSYYAGRGFRCWITI